jgi:carboxymethylenebutenolidase
MDQRLIDLYDEFVHVHFDRRLFLEKAARIVGSTAAAAALLPLFQSNYALAEVIAKDDPRISTKLVVFKGPTGDVKAYSAAPKAAGRRGGVLVVHQNRGLNPHIEDIARRLAVVGYSALAVDFLSPLGGTPSNEDAAMAMFSKLDAAGVDGDGRAGLDWLSKLDSANGKTGAVGFCWGGGVVNRLAVETPTLSAAVAYYGEPPDLAKVKDIRAHMLLNYADPTLDKRLGAVAPDYDKALKAAGVDFALYYYRGANHAFNDDTQKARYDEPAASLAWKRTLDLFARTLA